MLTPRVSAAKHRAAQGGPASRGGRVVREEKALRGLQSALARESAVQDMQVFRAFVG